MGNNIGKGNLSPMIAFSMEQVSLFFSLKGNCAAACKIDIALIKNDLDGVLYCCKNL